MMPMAPTSIMAIPTSKPKIGFSIDSIVGSNTANQNHNNNNIKLKSDLGQLTTKTPLYFSPNSEGSELPASPLSDDCYAASDVSSFGGRHGNYISSKSSPTTDINRALRLSNCSPEDFHARIPRYPPKTDSSSPPPAPPASQTHFRDLHSPNSRNNLNTNGSALPMHPELRTPPVNTRLSPGNHSPHARSPTPPQTQLPTAAKGPIVVPGIPAGLVRPFPVGPGGMPPPMPDVKPIPPYLNTGEMVQPHNPHFLAAQFQMAAAIAHQQSGVFPPQHPAAHMPNPNMPRESYPLYPWLLSRHGRIFPHRFPGNFLLQPFRKPKRVRTAFSPSQLLKLEHAFESNHYVVGAERKTLAQTLSLTETQVKVWFQNRRTKHKRMQQEDDAKNGGTSARSPGSYDDEDELIDMEMDDECLSDEEEQ